jgi:hypothetical protein
MRGYQCGQVWGSALAAGAQAYRRYGSGSKAQTAAIIAARRIVESFAARNGSVDCRTITDTDFRQKGQVLRYFLKNGVKCFRIAAQYAPVAFDEIETALAEEPTESPAPPVGCAAVLAQRLGASDLHTVMASGFAGGIGLSGNGCGALGAAVWITDINDRKRGTEKVGFVNPRLTELIDRFAARTDGAFACSAITGRRFATIADHAAYLRDGGCAEIIELLAATGPTGH